MIAFAIAALGLLGADGTEDFDAFFARYSEKRDGIQALEARFTQKSVVTGEPTVETLGDLVYVRPRRIVLRTQDPETATLVEGSMFYEFDADFKQVTITPLEDEAVADIFFIAFDDNTEGLRENYTINLVERENPKGREGLLITPKTTEDAAPPFQELMVFLRDTDMLPYEVRITFDEDSLVFFYIMDYTVNGQLPSGSTQLSLPEGTKVIEAGELRETVGAAGKLLPAPAVPPATPGTGG